MDLWFLRIKIPMLYCTNNTAVTQFIHEVMFRCVNYSTGQIPIERK